MAAVRGRSITEFGGLFGSLSVSGSVNVPAITPAHRIFRVRLENRTAQMGFENRVIKVGAENRIYTPERE